MEFLTNDKLTIVGAAGMIGSNMAQTALMMRLTPNVCLYDPYEKGLQGVAEELFHCGLPTLPILKRLLQALLTLSLQVVQPARPA